MVQQKQGAFVMKIKIGIIGAAGYTAGELIRILINHPNTEVVYYQSSSQAGKKVSSIHQDLYGEIEASFSNNIHFDLDLLFLCSGHGRGKTFLEENNIPENVAIIDLGNDFRLNFPPFVYGLAEVNQPQYGNRIANPGCFATAMQLGLLPLAQINALKNTIVINGITGSTGAGQNPSATTHFSWRNNNISAYKVFEHQHIPEVEQTLKQFQKDIPAIYFVPIRGDFPRGIFATIQTETTLSLTEIKQQYNSFYQDKVFVNVSEDPIHLKQVVNTNKTVMHLQKKDNQLLITVAIDNLLKGASGQAVQNMNLLFNLPETTGLNLKASAF